MGETIPQEINRRRSPRYAVAVPVDVVVLRSGVPDKIPGRSLDVGQGGLGALLAGELRPGESVGVEFQLPSAIEPVQAKAQVRHLGPLRCGLQFLAMSPEQEAALRAWANWLAGAPDIGRHSPSPVPAASERTSRRVSRRRPDSDRRPWRGLVLAVIMLAAVLGGWWWWRRGWSELEGEAPEASLAAGQQPTRVPGSVMEQRALHKVEPVYPQEAEQSKLQGLVVLDVVIGADGAVKNLRPLIGPDVLTGAAMEAVQWWRFQPYQINGQPATVETTIEVEFRLPP